MTDRAEERQVLEDRRRIIKTDIEELSQQVAVGEIDDSSAGRLFAQYSVELREVEAELTALPSPAAPPDVAPDTPDAEDDPAPIEDRRSFHRAITGSLVLIAALTVVIAWVARSTEPESPAVADVALGPIDSIDPGTLTGLSAEELATVLEAHPDLVEARLLLADVYLEAGENQLALENYLLVTAGEATAAEESRASGRIGYLAYVTGQEQAARDFLEQAVSLDPVNYEAKLFLGMVLLYGFDDAQAAAPLLEEVAELPDLPDEVRAELAAALAAAGVG
jgi:cytochrome c-type biogenesis protein CcmH/NrfG